MTTSTFRIIKLSLLAVMAAMLFLLPMAASAAPIDVFEESCDTDAGRLTEICKDRDENLFGAGSVWNRVINTFIFIIGIVSVFIIMLGGFKYITANGDSSALTSAKNTILYAVVGLAVALSAYAIVNFVITNLV